MNASGKINLKVLKEMAREMAEKEPGEERGARLKKEK